MSNFTLKSSGPLITNLKACWAFDEGSGTTVEDLVSGNDFVEQSGSETWTTLDGFACLKGDTGNGDDWQASGASDWKPPNGSDFTLVQAFAFNPTGAGNDCYLATSGYPNGWSFDKVVGANDDFWVYVESINGEVITAPALNQSATIGKLALVYRNGDGEVDVYVNGSFLTTVTPDDDANLFSTDNYILFDSVTPTPDDYELWMHRLYVWHEALSATQVADVHNDLDILFETGTSVTPSDLSSAVEIESPTPTPNYSASPAELSSDVVADSPTASVNWSVAPQGLSSTATIDSPTVSRNWSVTPDQTASATVMDSPAITVTGVLSPNSLSVATSIEEPATTLSWSLSPDSVDSQVSADSPAITINWLVSPADCASATVMDQSTVSILWDLSPDPKSIVSVIDSPSITYNAPTGVFAPNPIDIPVSIDEVIATPRYNTSPEGLSTATDIESPTLQVNWSVSGNALSVISDIESPTISIGSGIIPEGLEVNTEIDSVLVFVGYNASPNDISVSVGLDQVILTTQGVSTKSSLTTRDLYNIGIESRSLYRVYLESLDLYRVKTESKDIT